jgi:exopolysaccharide biosynthesis WecB/TagA/CpsF family protein
VSVASAQQIDGGHEMRRDTRWPVRHLLLGVPVSAAGPDEAERCILAAAREGRAALVDHLSAHGLAEARRDPRFREALARFDLVAADGQPVRWALNLLFGAGLRERVYGPALMDRLCARAAEEGLPIYLYGGSREVLVRLSENLRERHRGLCIAGAEAPPFRPLTPEEARASTERIARSGARLVFVGLGCPKQELFAAAHADRIPAVQLCVGAAFDFLAGTKPMAPRWMQARGLEWLFRLASEPRRLWRRYLVANSEFVVRLGGELLRRKPGARSRANVAAKTGSSAGEVR